MEVGGDPADAGKAAHHRDIGLADFGPAPVHELDVLIDMGESEVAHAERDAAAGHLAVAGEVVERQRGLQEPEPDVAVDGVEQEPFGGRAVGERRIDDELRVGSRLRAAGPQQALGERDVVEPPGVGHELEVAEVHLPGRRHLSPHAIGRAFERVDRAVGRQPAPLGTADERVDRLAGRLAVEIHEREVNAAERMHRDPAAAHVVGRLVDFLPEPLGVVERFADEQVAEAHRVVVRRGAVHERDDRGRERLHLADPLPTVVRGHDDEAVVVGAVEEPDVRVFDPQVDGVDGGDLHGGGSGPPLSTVAKAPGMAESEVGMANPADDRLFLVTGTGFGTLPHCTNTNVTDACSLLAQPSTPGIGRAAFSTPVIRSSRPSCSKESRSWSRPMDRRMVA